MIRKLDKKWVLSFAVTIGLLGSSGCSSSFSTGTTPTSSPGNTSAGATLNWQNLDVSGQLATGRFANLSVLSLDKTNKVLTLTLPVPANPFLGSTSASLDVSELAGASLTMSPLTSGSSIGGSTFVLTVPLASLVKGANLPTPMTLPNGDALPGVSGGSLPGVAVTLPNITKVSAVVYLAANQVGIFVSTPFDPVVSLTAAIQSADGTSNWGSLTTVPAKSTFSGGYFVLIQLSSQVASVINSGL